MHNESKWIPPPSFLKWISIPVIIILYFVIRITFGLDKYTIIGFMFILFLFGATFEIVAFSFFSVALGAYILGWSVEANNYFSYVYIMLILATFKYLYQAYRDKMK